jgi:hypothetical protein
MIGVIKLSRVDSKACNESALLSLSQQDHNAARSGAPVFLWPESSQGLATILPTGLELYLVETERRMCR